MQTALLDTPARITTPEGEINIAAEVEHCWGQSELGKVPGDSSQIDLKVERSADGKGERRAQSRAVKKQARRARKKARKDPTPSTHRLVPARSVSDDDLAWGHFAKRRQRAAYVNQRDRTNVPKRKHIAVAFQLA